jgi:hypothetical protein
MNIREWTLPVYTILMQLATGSFLALWVLRSLGMQKYGLKAMDRIGRYPVSVIAFTILAAMIGSHLHLSRPYFSILAVLNFQSSWLSREIVFNMLYFLDDNHPAVFIMAKGRTGKAQIYPGLECHYAGYDYSLLYGSHLPHPDPGRLEHTLHYPLILWINFLIRHNVSGSAAPAGY